MAERSCYGKRTGTMNGRWVKIIDSDILEHTSLGILVLFAKVQHRNLFNARNPDVRVGDSVIYHALETIDG